MLEIEFLQRDSAEGMHVMRVWDKGELQYVSEPYSNIDLQNIRAMLHDELLWIDMYLRQQGYSNEAERVNASLPG